MEHVQLSSKARFHLHIVSWIAGSHYSVNVSCSSKNVWTQDLFVEESRNFLTLSLPDHTELPRFFQSIALWESSIHLDWMNWGRGGNMYIQEVSWLKKWKLDKAFFFLKNPNWPGNYHSQGFGFFLLNM